MTDNVNLVVSSWLNLARSSPLLCHDLSVWQMAEDLDIFSQMPESGTEDCPGVQNDLRHQRSVLGVPSHR